MPEMTGLEFLKAAKIIAPKIPVIIISAIHSERDLQKMFINEGAFSFQEKPFDIEQMLDTIYKAQASQSKKELSSEIKFIGSSDAVKELFYKLDKVKPPTLPF